MSQFSAQVFPVIGSDGRKIALSPLFQLDTGNLAAVELPFDNLHVQDEARLLSLSEVLRTSGAIFATGFVCAPMGIQELATPRLPEIMAALCRSMGTEPASLCLFFPDTLCLKLGLPALEQLLRFKRLGFRLGLDIENLNCMPGLFIEKLPVDVLRLSTMDTLALTEDPEAACAVLDFIRYAGNLLMLPAAKGLSSSGQMNMLRDMGVRIGQGPLFSSTSLTDATS
jgi:EAL domain-containing protein (putative c-di-GMP-specific phosphodiesterase class I)